MCRLRLIILLIFATVVFGSPASPPECSLDTLAGYETLPAGCVIGPLLTSQPNFVFSGFQFSASVLSGSPTLVGPADITVAPLFTSVGGEQLQFSSSGFTVETGQVVQYTIAYSIGGAVAEGERPLLAGRGPPPPEIINFHLAANGDPPPTAGTQIDTELCIGALFSDGACPSGVEKTLTVTDTGSSGLNISQTIGELGVLTTITLDGGSVPADPATLNSLTTTAGTDIPEPGTAFLGCCGLGLLALLVRRAAPKRR